MDTISVNISAEAVGGVGKAARLSNSITIYPQAGGVTIKGPIKLPTERGALRDHVFIITNGVEIKCILDDGLNATNFVTNLIARLDANLP